MGAATSAASIVASQAGGAPARRLRSSGMGAGSAARASSMGKVVTCPMILRGGSSPKHSPSCGRAWAERAGAPASPME
eukprot:scaffold1040_cov74-Isochrysis_galbana.AAC.1